MLIKKLLSTWLLAGCLAIPAVAGPGDGIRFDKLTLHPFVEGSVVYDSNIGLTQRSNLVDVPIDQQEESDTYFQLRYGLDFDYQRDRSALVGTLYGYNRYYQDFDLDNSGIGQTLSFSTGASDGLSLKLSESYSKLQDYSLQPTRLAGDTTVGNLLAEDRTDRLKRDIFSLSLGLSRPITAKMDAGLGYGYSMADYDDPSLFDTGSHSFSGNVSWETTPKTAAFLSGSLGLEDSDALENEGESRTVQVGLRSKATTKLSYNLGVGYTEYKADGLEGINTDGLSYSLGLGWQVSAKLSVQASANNSYSASSFAANNAREVQMAQLGASYQLTDAIALGAAISLRQDDFVNPVITPEGDVQEDRKTQAANLTANYAPPGRWYRFFASAGIEDSESEIVGEDYDQVRVSGGVNLVY